MKTYKIHTIKKDVFNILKPLQDKYAKKIYFLKQSWPSVAPDWAKDLTPYSIRQKTLTLKTLSNELILQYREKELLKICTLIIGDFIERIKIVKELN